MFGRKRRETTITCDSWAFLQNTWRSWWSEDWNTSWYLELFIFFSQTAIPFTWTEPQTRKQAFVSFLAKGWVRYLLYLIRLMEIEWMAMILNINWYIYGVWTKCSMEISFPVIAGYLKSLLHPSFKFSIWFSNDVTETNSWNCLGLIKK